MSRCDLLIVGAGPAGVAAAVQAERLGLAVRLVDRTGKAGGLVHEAHCVENYPGLPPLPGPAVAERLTEHLCRFSIEIERAEILGIRTLPSGVWGVSLANGHCEAKSVILATGTSPLSLETPWLSTADAPHVRYAPSEALRAPDLRQGAVVAIVGGGEASFDYALTLARSGHRVELLVRTPQPRARGRLVEQVRSCPSISLRISTIITHGVRTEGIWRLTIRTVDSHTCLHAGALVAAIGRVSRAALLLPGLDLAAATGITTQCPGLFVVGDARSGGLGQIGMAVGDGLAAAMQVARMI